MNTSNLEEMRQLSDAPTLILMIIMISMFIFTMMCSKVKDD